MKNLITKKHEITLIFLFTCLYSFGQTATYKWVDEACNYESKYNTKLYSAKQISNCFRLGYWDEFRITNTPLVFEPADIKHLQIDSLINEYEKKHRELQQLDLPNTEFWKELRNKKLQEQEKSYELHTIAYKAYTDPKSLEQFKVNDSCVIRHKNAVIAGGDSLLNDWKKLVLFDATKNGSPEELIAKYKAELMTNEKFEYAKVYIITFGWWNCAVHCIDYTTNKITREDAMSVINKMFISTKTIGCIDQD
jgi:hypothetical protein